MKKAFFATFAGICTLLSVMGSTANSGKINSKQVCNQIIRDTVPMKKADTSNYPKRDTTSSPRLDPYQQ